MNRRGDIFFALLTGGAVALLAAFWEFRAAPPDLAEDLAVAAGLRPPASPFPLLWHIAAAPLCRSLGLDAAGAVLRAAGHVSLGLIAAAAMFLYGCILPSHVRRGERIAAWWRFAVRTILAIGAVLFCCSYPVWNAFRWFSPLALQTLLAAAACIAFACHLRGGGRLSAFSAFAVAGVLAADAPFGVYFIAAAVTALCIRRRIRGEGLADPSAANPLAGLMMPLRLTIVFAACAGAAFAAETAFFAANDGFAANALDAGLYVRKWAVAYVNALATPFSPAGFAAVLGAVAFPFAAEARLVRRATDDEKPLPYRYGATFAAFGLVALSQLSGADSLWFWTWGGGCARDGLALCTATWFSAAAVAWPLAVFTVELWLRSMRRVALLRCPDALESNGADEAIAAASRAKRKIRVCLLAGPVLVLAAVVPFRSQRLEREMLRIVDDAARETARECRGFGLLFTDGGLDAATELAAAASGGRLCALSMMADPSSPRERYLRRRGADGAEAEALLDSGAPDALRIWAAASPGKAPPFALQLGFELWRRLSLPPPACSGFVASPSGFPPGEAERGTAAARALASRILAIYEAGLRPDAVPDRALRDAFLFVQWRLAVLARHRANAFDAKGDAESALLETHLADALDSENAALAHIRETMAWESRRRLERMTPQEGLDIGLSRADFALARVFALKVLDVSPDDPAANFAVGMDFFVQRQYARAEVHLARCLERRPRDPAVLNNLAQCRLRQGDPAGARGYALKAREVLPDSPEISRTLERIEKALRLKASP